MYMGYMNFGPMGYGPGWDHSFFAFAPFIIIVIVWSLLWKGMALWRAAHHGDTWWFIAFLVINTLGILEIIYLFVITGAKLSDFTNKLTHHEHHQS